MCQFFSACALNIWMRRKYRIYIVRSATGVKCFCEEIIITMVSQFCQRYRKIGRQRFTCMTLSTCKLRCTSLSTCMTLSTCKLRCTSLSTCMTLSTCKLRCTSLSTCMTLSTCKLRCTSLSTCMTLSTCKLRCTIYLYDAVYL